MTGLSLRSRLILLTALAVAVAVAGGAAATWWLARDQLYKQLDRTLSAGPGGPKPRKEALARERVPERDFVGETLDACRSEPSTVSRGYAPWRAVQVVRPDGGRCLMNDSELALVVAPVDLRVATGRLSESYHDGYTTTGVAMRVYTTWDAEHQVAISRAEPLGQTQQTLSNLALLLVMVSAIGIVAAGSAGLLIARSVLHPVDRLTATVEHIARTEDLSTDIPIEGKDEIARLSRSFNIMTKALARSREHQKQLIADAGHELRTPLTSLRTNIDLLLRSETTGRDLPADTRSRLLKSTKAQMLELTSLVGDLLELGRPEDKNKPRQLVELHEVVERAVERARLRGPNLSIEVSAQAWRVYGDPGLLERAVMNLLDNAVKFSPHGGTVQVRLLAGELTVRDHGPGIAEDELPHVFERFWRSPSARSMPGSGLGLSIVARVAGECGGAVRLEAAPGGGTLARLRLPGNTPEHDPGDTVTDLDTRHAANGGGAHPQVRPITSAAGAVSPRPGGAGRPGGRTHHSDDHHDPHGTPHRQSGNGADPRFNGAGRHHADGHSSPQAGPPPAGPGPWPPRADFR